MGLFDKVSKALFGEADYKTPQASQATAQAQFADIFNVMFEYPELFEGLQMASALGKDPMDYINSFLSPTKDAASGTGLKLPSGKFLDTGKLSQANTALKVEFQDKQIADAGSFYNKLSQVPGMAPIFADAAGNFSPQFTSQINQGYEQLANASLGVGAKSGFLSDPLKQAKILGPLAMQKAAYLKSVQQQAQGQALSLSGMGSLVGVSPMALSGMGVSPYSQASAGAAGLFGGTNASLLSQGSFLNSQLGLDASKFNTGMGFQFGMNSLNALGGLLGGGG